MSNCSTPIQPLLSPTFPSVVQKGVMQQLPYCCWLLERAKNQPADSGGSGLSLFYLHSVSNAA